MNINHETLERIAREICDNRNGAGHYDAKGTKKNHWRKRALPLAMLAIDRQGVGIRLMQVCGWLK